MKAIVLAGGEGRRLRPYTTVLPKPLMPLGQVPVLQVLLQWMSSYGVTDVTLSVGYLASLIETYLVSFPIPGMKVRFLHEPRPLSTAGPLALLRREFTDPFLVVNGDTYTNLDLRAFQESHCQGKATMTIAAHRQTVKVDLGVLETESNGKLVAFREKPELNYLASMGVNVLSPKAVEYIPNDRSFGFDELIQALLKAGEPINVYEHQGFWFDIGREQEYQRALQRAEEQNRQDLT